MIHDNAAALLCVVFVSCCVIFIYGEILLIAGRRRRS